MPEGKKAPRHTGSKEAAERDQPAAEQAGRQEEQAVDRNRAGSRRGTEASRQGRQ